MGNAWIFGYGSLVFRSGFTSLSQESGWLAGFRRRLWQGSPDHRGTPDRPGRVATLVAEPGARVLGVAFEVHHDTLETVIEQLDLREKAGYERLLRPVELTSGRIVEAIVYAAGPENPSWLGPADPEAIARHVASAHGPSGPNRDYVLSLARALRELGDFDEEVFAVAAALEGLEPPI